MGSTFSALEIGKQGIMAHQKALNVVGHNIANANTEGYSRQQVELSADSPLYPPGIDNPNLPGQIGTGSSVSFILRVRDVFLDDRMAFEQQNLSKWEGRSDKLHQLELIFNEPQDTNLRQALNQFWESMQDLNNDPESKASRAMVVARGDSLAGVIRHSYSQMQFLRDDIDKQVKVRVEEINDFAKNIAELNRSIQIARANGENPNDMMDKREVLVQKAAGLSDVIIARTDEDDFSLTIDGKLLVQGEMAFRLGTEQDRSNSALTKIIHEDTRDTVYIKAGKLKGLIEVRDDVIPENLRAMDELAITLIDRINEVHRSGFGLDGSTGLDFFDPAPVKESAKGVYKVTGSEYIHQTDKPLLGLDGNNDPYNPYFFSPYTDPDNPLTSKGSFEINGTFINYDASVDSLKEIVDRINETKAGVVASISPAHRLTLTATAESGFEITSLSDDPKEWKYVRSQKEVVSGTGTVDLNGGLDSANFGQDVGGKITVNNVTFSLANYGSVSDLMQAINHSKAGVVLEYDEKNDRFTLENKVLGNDLVLSEDTSSTPGKVGFFTAVNISPEDPTPLHGNLLEKLGILKDDKNYDTYNPNARDNLAADWVGVPITGAATQMSVSARIKENVDRIAAAKGIDNSDPLDGIADISNGEGDGSNALAMAGIKGRLYLAEGTANFDDFFSGVVAKVGANTAEASREVENRELYMENLKNLRDSISGVSLDEEMTNLIRYQQGYSAVARFVATINRVLDRVMTLGQA
ncbi:MAG: flagellar hook-associated protein FlgK [bacterium]|nr:flagellar hook-associated protein FlgK [bacterium]